jgi:hypothetical protein
MFASVIAKVVTALCAIVGATAFVGTLWLTVTGGSTYLEFALAVVFFTMFLIGSYWWIGLWAGPSALRVLGLPRATVKQMA